MKPAYLLVAVAAGVSAAPQDPSSDAVERPVPFAVNAVAGSSVNKVIPIVVGGSTLTFFPNSVSANPGDILQFQFAARNHTVTQSSESNPCQPLLDTVGNAVHSGFVPYENGSSTVGTFNVPVKDTNPMFLYCAQGQHCQAGMVMAINPSSSQQLIVYANNAATAKNNVPGKFISGGASGVLPAASAAFPAGGTTTSTSSARGDEPTEKRRPQPQ